MKSGVEISINELFLENHSLVLKKTRNHYGFGSKLSRIHGRGMEYVESRPYVVGDELKTVDWRVFARLNKMHTKVYALEIGRPVYIIADFSNTMFFGSRVCFKSVLAAKIAARIIKAAFNGHDQVALLAFNNLGKQFLGLSGAQHRVRLLALLASMCQLKPAVNGSSLWLEVFQHLIKLKTKGGLLYLISDFNDFTLSRENLACLRQYFHIVALRVSDPLEQDLPNLGWVSLQFNDQVVSFDSNDKSLRNRYQESRQAYMDTIRDRFLNQALLMLDISTKDDLSLALKPLLVKRQ